LRHHPDKERTMQNNNPLLQPGVCALAQAIARGELSALGVTEDHIARLEAAHARLNALTARRYDAARREARDIDARRARGEALPPLAGVPITVKDSIDVAGLPSTFGLAWRKDVLAERDDAHVARLRAQGAVVLAKSNVAQLLIYYESDNPLHGRTLHPSHPDRTPGGSSGGEAALVAAGASPLGLGTDIGGSVRVPAHFCGIAGIKPTEGRCNDPGRFSIPAGMLAVRSQIGPLARNVADLALALRHLQAGPQDGVPALADPAEVDVAKLRIGWFDDDGMFPASPAIRRAVREAARALSDAGARVVPSPQPAWPQLLGLTMRLMTADGGATMTGMLRNGPRNPTAGTLMLLGGMPAPLRRLTQGLLNAVGQPTLAGMLGVLGRTDVRGHWAQAEALQELRRACLAGLDATDGGPLDILLSPVCSLPAFTHGASRDLGVAGSYAMAINALGWPAGSMPWTQVRAGEESERPATRDRVFALARQVEQGSAGLPVGVQVIGRPWRDHQVLAVMQALEQRRPGS
jgi:fatty acid amide hydrolase